MATVVVTYHNLVNKFKYTNIGNAAWKSMCECYDGDVMINVTEYPPKSKLQSYCLTLSSNSENYINNLLTTYRESTIYLTFIFSRMGFIKNDILCGG